MELYILIFLLVCFGIYKLRQMSIERNTRPLWNTEDEECLKDILSQIYSSVTLENLKDVFGGGVRRKPMYHDLFSVAMEEKKQQITQNSISSFEIKESNTRKTWILSFCGYFFLCWLLIILAVFFIDSPTEGLSARLGAIMIITPFIGIMMWVVYYCAYKKKGTGLLSWIVFMSPLQLLRSVAREGIDLSLWYFTVIELALFGFFWFSSLNLRKINYEVKTRRQLTALRELL